ncbi:MAG: Serine-protein kinase RsbW [Ignavibacteria bacterium]|nr:Serine-protein kinase RsbW [Ignavibacteria bacterium]
MQKYILILKSSRNEISKFEELLQKVNAEFGMSQEKFINLQIACSEALINAIVHGNKEQNGKQVYTEILHDYVLMCIRIKDEGEGFDLNSVPDPTSSDNILKEHGRGIYIIKSLVDEFECNSSKNGTEYLLKIKK